MCRVWTRPQLPILDNYADLSSLSTLFEKYRSNDIRKELINVEEK